MKLGLQKEGPRKAWYVGAHLRMTVFLLAGLFFFFLVLFTSSCFPVSLEKPKGQSDHDQPPFLFFFFKLKSHFFSHRKKKNEVEQTQHTAQRSHCRARSMALRSQRAQRGHEVQQGGRGSDGRAAGHPSALQIHAWVLCQSYTQRSLSHMLLCI